MSKISRRAFMEMSIALGATAAWGRTIPSRSKIAWRERRDFFPEGVASGDPDSNSVLLWTRRPPAASDAANHTIEQLSVEVSEDEAFTQIIATAEAPISAASDWTCRVLVGKLKPSHVYWYRFTDADGNGSRIGRTITAPAENDPRPVQFAFVSCQNANRRRAKRLPPHDLRRRACRRKRSPRLRPSPRRFHLRNCLVSRRSSPRNVRSQNPRHRPLRARRKTRRLSHSDGRRRLPRHLSQLSPRSRSTGCSRAISIRLHVG